MQVHRLVFPCAVALIGCAADPAISTSSDDSALRSHPERQQRRPHCDSVDGYAGYVYLENQLLLVFPDDEAAPSDAPVEGNPDRGDGDYAVGHAFASFYEPLRPDVPEAFEVCQRRAPSVPLSAEVGPTVTIDPVKRGVPDFELVPSEGFGRYYGFTEARFVDAHGAWNVELAHAPVAGTIEQPTTGGRPVHIREELRTPRRFEVSTPASTLADTVYTPGEPFRVRYDASSDVTSVEISVFDANDEEWLCMTRSHHGFTIPAEITATLGARSSLFVAGYRDTKVRAGGKTYYLTGGLSANYWLVTAEGTP